MKKIRINELARELEIKAHELLERLPEVGVTEKKTHSSSVDEDVAIRLRRLYGTGSSRVGSIRSRRGARGSGSARSRGGRASGRGDVRAGAAGVGGCSPCAARNPGRNCPACGRRDSSPGADPAAAGGPAYPSAGCSAAADHYPAAVRTAGDARSANGSNPGAAAAGTAAGGGDCAGTPVSARSQAAAYLIPSWPGSVRTAPAVPDRARRSARPGEPMRGFRANRRRLPKALAPLPPRLRRECR